MDFTLFILVAIIVIVILLQIAGVISRSSTGLNPGANFFQIVKDPYLDYVNYRWTIVENYNQSWIRIEMHLKDEAKVAGIYLIAKGSRYGSWHKKGHIGITLLGLNNKIKVSGGSTNCSTGNNKEIVSSVSIESEEIMGFLKIGISEICIHNTQGNLVIASNLENSKKVYFDLKKIIEDNKFQSNIFSLPQNKLESVQTATLNDLYQSVHDNFEKLKQLTSEILTDTNIITKIKSKNKNSKLEDNILKEIITELIENDVLSILNKLNSIYTFLNTESIIAQYFIFTNYCLNEENKQINSFEILNDGKVKKTILARLEKVKNKIAIIGESDEIIFKLEEVIEDSRPDILSDYISILYRIAVLTSKHDNDLTDSESLVLRTLKAKINKKKSNNKSSSLETASLDSKNIRLEKALMSLNSLIGLDSVKKEIISIINFIEVQNKRRKSSLKTPEISYHLVFTGNPGTGKTTVARLLANIFKEMGIVKKGHLIETDRSGLIAEYVGQTAIKVNKIVDAALDGVLFIDEAYSLIGSNGDTFGDEAVSTLIKRIEDDRDRLVVILAGYTKEMEDFIETNPGFKSRFNRFIEFQDYSNDELLKIFKKYCYDQEYILDIRAEIKLLQLFQNNFDKPNNQKSSGNGRYVRNLFEKSIQNQANRLSNNNQIIPKEELSLIIEEDLNLLS